MQMDLEFIKILKYLKYCDVCDFAYYFFLLLFFYHVFTEKKKNWRMNEMNEISLFSVKIQEGPNMIFGSWIELVLTISNFEF